MGRRAESSSQRRQQKGRRRSGAGKDEASQGDLDAGTSTGESADESGSAEGSVGEPFEFTPDPSWTVYVRGMREKQNHADNDPAFSIPESCVVNCCSGGKEPFRSGLSPFFVGPVTLPFSLSRASGGHRPEPCVARNLENAWQFAKVYDSHLVESSGKPTSAWRAWARDGFADPRAHRFPMGRGAKPKFSFGGFRDDGTVIELDYIEARHRLYAPLYAKAVVRTAGFRQLVALLQRHGRVTLLDHDGWDHRALGLSLSDVMYYPHDKMGHGFVLAMLLTGELPWEEEFGGEERVAEVCARVDASARP